MNGSEANTGAGGGGIDFIGLLQIVFITLKLLDKIKWHWMWVLAPTWIYALFMAVVVISIIILEARNR